jgi:hypothetical protein
MTNEDKLNQIFDNINSIRFKGSNEYELHLKAELLHWMNEVSTSAEVIEVGNRAVELMKQGRVIAGVNPFGSGLNTECQTSFIFTIPPTNEANNNQQ